MTEKTVSSLYGLKVGDHIKYVANNKEHFDPLIFNLEGQIENIKPFTGEFIVRSKQTPFMVSFSRTDLLLLGVTRDKNVDFHGIIFDTPSLSLNEMYSYLTKYHDLNEGIDFSLSYRDEKKEVHLTNTSYASLVKDLITMRKVNKEIGEKNHRDFKHTMKTEVINDAISLRFKLSDWTFRTHLTPWGLQQSFFIQHDLDMQNEWGIDIK